MTTTTATFDFTLRWSPAGKLVLTRADGTQHEGVVPVRAFPISAAEEGLSLVDADGHELAWINALADLQQAQIWRNRALP